MPVLSPKVLQPVQQPLAKTLSSAEDVQRKAAGNSGLPSSSAAAGAAAAAAVPTSTAGNQPMVMHLQPPYPFGATTAYSYGQAGTWSRRLPIC